MTRIEVFQETEWLAAAAADLVLHTAREAVRERGRFVWGLSGGSTPAIIYRTLAGEPYAAAMPWDATYVFWGDERWVAANDPDSNQRMANATLLSRVPLDSTHIIPITTTYTEPSEAAGAAERRLRDLYADADAPCPDLVLLGIGTDGHTASLFPGTSALAERERLFAANWVPQFDTWRITATYPLLNAARHVAFIAQGADKAEPVSLAIHPPNDTPRSPAALIEPNDGILTWFLDRQAAARLPDNADTKDAPPGGAPHGRAFPSAALP